MQQPNNNDQFRLDGRKHKKVLKRHLREFFRLLDSNPKPSNERVRAEFIRHEAEWRMYSVTHCLGTRIADLFNANVSLAWEKNTLYSTTSRCRLSPRSNSPQNSSLQ